MGLLDKVLGNAAEIDVAELQEEFQQILLPDEEITRAYQVFRDSFVFTTWRLILVDRQGLTGSKVEYRSYPYKSITHFAVETAGSFDLDAELKIWITGRENPVSKEFNRKLNVYDVQRVLAHYVLR